MGRPVRWIEATSSPDSKGSSSVFDRESLWGPSQRAFLRLAKFGQVELVGALGVLFARVWRVQPVRETPWENEVIVRDRVQAMIKDDGVDLLVKMLHLVSGE